MGKRSHVHSKGIMFKKNALFDHEATIIARYFQIDTVDKQSIQLYESIINSSAGALSTKEHKLVALAFRRPWIIPYLDAALALKSPNVELRRRLYIMFAILESHPQYSQQFLSQHHSPLYVVNIACIGLRSVIKAAVGLMILTGARLA